MLTQKTIGSLGHNVGGQIGPIRHTGTSSVMKWRMRYQSSDQWPLQAPTTDWSPIRAAARAASHNLRSTTMITALDAWDETVSSPRQSVGPVRTSHRSMYTWQLLHATRPTLWSQVLGYQNSVSLSVTLCLCVRARARVCVSILFGQHLSGMFNSTQLNSILLMKG